MDAVFIMLLPQSFKNVGDVDLIGLIITGQGIHHQIDTETERHFLFL